MITASAPGKIILFGEHAVVYGRPALAVPVTQVHADVSTGWITDAQIDTDVLAGAGWQDSIFMDAPDIGLQMTLAALQADQPAHPLAAAIVRTLEALGPLPTPLISSKRGERTRGVRIQITSTIPVASGLGSGAAVSVALTRSLSAFLGRPLSDEQVSEIAFEVDKLHHGTPSGIDNTVITYARPVYFVKGQPIEMLQVRQPFALVIGDTGVPAPTKESVGDVHKLWEADRARWEAVFNEVARIVEKARSAIESGQTAELGPLMDANHALLQQLTVSSPELDRLVLAARGTGAAGAKLSGGGRGGNMIALVHPDSAESVSSSLKKAGAVRAIITTIQ